MNRFRQRRGFTLVEMLVVMGIIVLITAAAMLVVPGALDKDRSTDAATSLRGWLEIAQARASRDGAPRGVRLIMNGSTHVTEAQYIESPPVLVFNQTPPLPNGFVFGTPPNVRPHGLTPRVEFVYGVELPTGIPGRVNNRRCFIRGLDPNQAALIVSYTANNQQPIMWLPVLGTWHRIVRPMGAVQAEPAPVAPLPPYTAAETPYYIEVELDQYPDTQLGAGTFYVTYHFGIYGPARPLLGEPTMQLPTNTCVDLSANVSIPNGVADLAATRDYDILFAPSGSIAFTPSIGGDPHILLTVRDPRRVSPSLPNDFTNIDFIRAGGEMLILAIKSRSGAIGVQPVDHNPITVTNPLAPYSFALQSVSSQ